VNNQDQNSEEQARIAQPEQTTVAVATGPPEGVATASHISSEQPVLRKSPKDFYGLQTFLTVVVFAVFVITFIVQAFQIPSGSMENTLLVGDFLLVDKLHFDGGANSAHLLPDAPIQRDDIIVFYFPVDPSQFLVKRVIGVPGDRIHMQNKTVYVNDQPLEESYTRYDPRIPDAYREPFPQQLGYSREIERRWRNQMLKYVQNGDLIVPPDHYFVMGDNRDNSLDSRFWGFVPRANIVGRPLVIYLSVRGSEPDSANGKLVHSGEMLTHLLHVARWDRTFRLVR
jgi:signal peptidase I